MTRGSARPLVFYIIKVALWTSMWVLQYQRKVESLNRCFVIQILARHFISSTFNNALKYFYSTTDANSPDSAHLKAEKSLCCPGFCLSILPIFHLTVFLTFSPFTHMLRASTHTLSCITLQFISTPSLSSVWNQSHNTSLHPSRTHSGPSRISCVDLSAAR